MRHPPHAQRRVDTHERDLLDLCKRNLASIKSEVAAGTQVDPAIILELEENLATLEKRSRRDARG
ncbi:MAG TPA: hypothetical protein VGO43_05890 [Pyrinomonadaceae bacterium]|jgi:hypothetical protein|nr:hypothetical protein [Pyrinomonadaceae bacterium]